MHVTICHLKITMHVTICQLKITMHVTICHLKITMHEHIYGLINSFGRNFRATHLV